MSRYVASTAVQECRQEFIEDLESMVEVNAIEVILIFIVDIYSACYQYV